MTHLTEYTDPKTGDRYRIVCDDDRRVKSRDCYRARAYDADKPVRHISQSCPRYVADLTWRGTPSEAQEELDVYASEKKWIATGMYTMETCDNCRYGGRTADDHDICRCSASIAMTEEDLMIDHRKYGMHCCRYWRQG